MFIVILSQFGELLYNKYILHSMYTQISNAKNTLKERKIQKYRIKKSKTFFYLIKSLSPLNVWSLSNCLCINLRRLPPCFSLCLLKETEMYTHSIRNHC